MTRKVCVRSSKVRPNWLVFTWSCNSRLVSSPFSPKPSQSATGSWAKGNGTPGRPLKVLRRRLLGFGSLNLASMKKGSAFTPRGLTQRMHQNTSSFTLSKLLVLNAVLDVEIHAYSACVYVCYVDWVCIMMINFFFTAHAFQVGYIWETSKRYERPKCKNAERNLRKPCLTVAHPPQLDSQVSHSQSPSNDSEWLIHRNASLQYDGILNMYILHIYIYTYNIYNILHIRNYTNQKRDSSK